MFCNLKSSTAKREKPVCIIKLNRNNLSGELMKLNNLGNNNFNYKPTQIGIYRIYNNARRNIHAMHGCYLYYQKTDNQSFLNYTKISDEDVRKMSNEQINDEEYINNLGREKSANYNTK